eukprot:Seg3896.1 transcript_id=Seg3896.1/GoldUCD/mRNA.D3Y31 product="hypothetical protein" protein_id=Seg3896.1/GoldUCD/D3Y31
MLNSQKVIVLGQTNELTIVHSTPISTKAKIPRGKERLPCPWSAIRPGKPDHTLKDKGITISSDSSGVPKRTSIVVTTNKTQSKFTQTCRRFLARASAADVSRNDQNNEGKDGVKVQKEASVTVSVDWPRQSFQRKLPEDLSSLGKMLLRGTYKQIIGAVWKHPELRAAMVNLFRQGV